MRGAWPVIVRLDRNVLVAVLALIALLTPTFSAFSPEIAGWTPTHGHLFRGGIPVAHRHPGDAPADATPRGFVLCNVHGAPHASPDAGAGASPAGMPSEATDGVALTFEGLGLFTSLIAPAASLLPACPQPVSAPLVAMTFRPASVVVAPAPQPPQA